MDMSGVGTLGIGGLIVIVVALVLWIAMVTRAGDRPAKTSSEEPARGPVSGGVMRGDPGQVNPTGEAPRMDEEPPADRPGED
jgi:hypothetical protein